MKLADALKEKGLKYTEVAAACRVHPKTVQRWMVGSGQVPLCHADTLSRLLGEDVGPLYGVRPRFLPLQDGVPLVPRGAGGGKGVPKPKAYVPWSRFEIGQSCFAPETLLHRHGVMACAMRANWRYGFKFALRTVIENGVRGVRIWRVE